MRVDDKILAEVEFTPDSQAYRRPGLAVRRLLAVGIDGKRTYVYNFLGIPPEQRIVADAPTSGTHIVGIDFTKERVGEHHEPHGRVRLFVGEDVVAEDEFREIASRFSLCAKACASDATAATR